MFTVQLTNHQFGHTSHYGSFATLADAQAAAGRAARHSGLRVRFCAVLTPADVTPKPLHPIFLAD